MTSGAHGIAYSCLLDVMANSGRFAEAAARLNKGLNSGGVRLEDVNRTALLRLKAGVEAAGGVFSHDIPKKTSRSNRERSVTPMEE